MMSELLDKVEILQNELECVNINLEMLCEYAEHRKLGNALISGVYGVRSHIERISEDLSNAINCEYAERRNVQDFAVGCKNKVKK